MSLFQSMMSANFRVNPEGETVFFFPVFGGVWCPRKGYRISSEEDIAILKRYLRRYLGILLSLLALVCGFVVGYLGVDTGTALAALLVGCALAGAINLLIFDRVFIRKVVGKYEATEDRPRFKDLQRLQAENQSRSGIVMSFLANLFFLLVGVVAALTGIAVVPGIVLVVIFSLSGALVTYQLALRRQGK